MDNLLKLNPCTSDKPQQLRYLYDQMQVQIRGLESLGITTESYGQLSIPIIMSTLPNEIQLQISRNTDKEKWDIQELLELIQKEIEARETTEHIKARTERVKPFSNFSNSENQETQQQDQHCLRDHKKIYPKDQRQCSVFFCGKLHFQLHVKK